MDVGKEIEEGTCEPETTPVPLVAPAEDPVPAEEPEVPA